MNNKMKNMKSKIKNQKQELKKLRLKLDQVTQETGIEVDEELTDHFQTIIHEATQDVHQKHPLDSFKRIFWEQQVKALKQNKRQVRWHPMFIKWCLSLKLLS